MSSEITLANDDNIKDSVVMYMLYIESALRSKYYSSMRLARPVGLHSVRSQCQLPFRGAARQTYGNQIVTHRGYD
jgi:hypothetical protein